MISQIFLWIFFNIFVILMLALDLGVFHRKAHVVKVGEAMVWSGVWIGLALIFSGMVYFWRGHDTALEFLTGYLIEKSLSVDNIFIFVLIFSYFNVPPLYQHKILFWGIVGALLMRALFIVAGVTMIQKFHWIIYLFGAFLILTGARMAWEKGRKVHPEKNPVLRLFRRFVPITDGFVNGFFLVKQEGRRLATPLLVVLLVVETTDIIFAIDSIPAILAITLDPFIVYSSNVFAILGLRALYFALAGIIRLFEYLHYGLSAILIFVGIKMILADIYKIPIVIALGVIAAILFFSVILSILYPSGRSE
ncbi:MAG: TerC family protein [Thermodesulfobacteriota bacterium]